MGFWDIFSFKSNVELYQKQIEDEARRARSPKRQRNALEETFRRPVLLLEKLFVASPDTLTDEVMPTFPRTSYFGDVGVKAYMQKQNIELSLFPRYLNIIRDGYEEVQVNHFEKGNFHSFVRYDEELGGRNVWLLTNDVEIIRKLAAGRFNPTPPWIVWYQDGPFVRYTQGGQEYWYDHFWEPFWSSLSIEEQNAFLRDRRAESASYISDEDWADWIFHIRMLDKRTREILERDETP